MEEAGNLERGTASFLCHRKLRKILLAIYPMGVYNYRRSYEARKTYR